jgi:U3 small nucleolar RNA-associated protein 14
MLDGNNERMAKRKAGKFEKSYKGSYVDDIMWDNAVERGQAAKDLLIGGLEFKDEDILYLEDKSKEDIYATLFELKQEAMDFENKKREGIQMTQDKREKAGLPGLNDNFGIVVLHVGHILDPLQARYKNNLNDIWKPEVYPKT